MTREQIEKEIEKVVPDGFLYSYCKDYFFVGIKGSNKGNFCVDMRPLTKNGHNYGMVYSDRKIVAKLKDRWELCRCYYERV